MGNRFIPLTIELKERIRPYASDANLFSYKDHKALEFFQRIIDNNGYGKEDWVEIKKYLKGIATYESDTPQIDREERKKIREQAVDDIILFAQNNYEQK